jgi:hypothetical protein
MHIVAHIENLLSSDALQPEDRATYEKVRSDEQAKLTWAPAGLSPLKPTATGRSEFP